MASTAELFFRLTSESAWCNFGAEVRLCSDGVMSYNLRAVTTTMVFFFLFETLTRNLTKKLRTRKSLEELADVHGSIFLSRLLQRLNGVGVMICVCSHWASKCDTFHFQVHVQIRRESSHALPCMRVARQPMLTTSPLNTFTSSAYINMVASCVCYDAGITWV